METVLFACILDAGRSRRAAAISSDAANHVAPDAPYPWPEKGPRHGLAWYHDGPDRPEVLGGIREFLSGVLGGPDAREARSRRGTS